jgi:hypothetical protein
MEKKGKTKSLSWTLTIVFLKFLRAVAIGVVIFSIWKFPLVKRIVHDFFEPRRVYDEAGILDKDDIRSFEKYTKWIFRESDIDIRLVFVKNTGGKTMEELAVKKMQELGIGRENREERGLLLLYDFERKKLRIEVGYGLEEYFPDAFVGYLVHYHARDHFALGDVAIGLNLLIRMLHFRIREQILGNNFDPRVIEIIRHRGYLSGGAGASGIAPLGRQTRLDWHSRIDQEDRKKYGPQPTPEAAYEKYLEWLAAGNYDPRIVLFTPQSRGFSSPFPMTRAYHDFILMILYAKEYEACVRNDLALLYCTNDPLVPPHFLKKTDKGWQMDMYAQFHNIQNRVGGVYAWDYCGRNDMYTKTFRDKLVNIRNHIRIADGDNRELPIRDSH